MAGARGGAASEREGKHAGNTLSLPAAWRTAVQQDIYSSKLLDALRRVRGQAPRQGRAVREAADRALASAASGRMRWSRAILSRRALVVKARRWRPAAPRTRRELAPEVRRKATALGRLVPGCRKLPLPALIIEASDYVAALEMQVRAMSALAAALSALQPGGSRPI